MLTDPYRDCLYIGRLVGGLALWNLGWIYRMRDGIKNGGRAGDDKGTGHIREDCKTRIPFQPQASPFLSLCQSWRRATYI